MALNVAVAYINKSQLPWWGVVMAIVMSTLLSLPLNMITAITGTGFGLNVFAEMICGFILPGLPGKFFYNLSEARYTELCVYSGQHVLQNIGLQHSQFCW